MGWKIFVKAIRLVFDNFGAALRISALLYLIPVVVGFVLTYLVVQSVLQSPPEARDFSRVTTVQTVAGLVSLAAALWIGVAWHRFILLDEKPGAVIPVFNGRRILSYFGYSLLLVLIALPFGLALLLLAFLPPPAGPMVASVGALVTAFVYLVVGYRLGVILPAAAVGRPLRLGEAWRATRGATGTIVVLALVTAISAIVIQLPALGMTGPYVIAGLLWRLVVGWLEVLVGVSILTTLYGYFVEHRAVD
jgi:hypothetical protein